MIGVDTLTVFFSWKCTFRCAHCGFSCGPDRSERLPLQEVLAAIEAVSAKSGVRMIAYSGGEPFLHYRDLLECMTLAHGKGLDGGVVTNCYWAVNHDVTELRMGQLTALGLAEVIVSVDDYHLRFVPLANIRRVVHAALERRVRVGVNMLVTKNSTMRACDVHRVLELPKELADDPRVLWIRESSPILAGRARSSFRRGELRTYGERELMDNPCYFVLRNMVLTPDRSVYACCGFGDASDDGPAAVAYVGSLQSSAVEDLFDRASRNLLLNLLYPAVLIVC